ncbi:MAG: DUF4430 domain-containing protein [Clostridia bacterium]|nr:DUF4430 domain-containing protein [Clostridia bacterium]
MKKRIIFFTLMLTFIMLFAFSCGEAQNDNADLIGSCTLKVDCITILSNMEKLNPDKVELIPEDGIIVELEDVDIYEGDTVYSVFAREMKAKGIAQSSTDLGEGMCYISSVSGIAEFDCTEMGGWMYLVNGESSLLSVNQQEVLDGDTIEIRYSCNWGEDIGIVFGE